MNVRAVKREELPHLRTAEQHIRPRRFDSNDSKYEGLWDQIASGLSRRGMMAIDISRLRGGYGSDIELNVQKGIRELAKKKYEQSLFGYRVRTKLVRSDETHHQSVANVTLLVYAPEHPKVVAAMQKK